MPNLGHGKGPFRPQAFFLPSQQVSFTAGTGTRPLVVNGARRKKKTGRVRVVAPRLAVLPDQRRQKPVVTRKKRPKPRAGKTTRVGAPLPAAVAPARKQKQPVVVDQSRARRRASKAVRLKTPLQPVAAPARRQRQPVVVDPSRSKKRPGKTVRIRSPLQTAVAPATRRQKAPVVILAPRRKKKTGRVRVASPRLAVLPDALRWTPLVIEGKKTRKRPGKATRVAAPRAAAAPGPSTLKQKQPLVVGSARPRRKPKLKLFIKPQRASAAAPPTRRQKQPLLVTAKRRKRVAASQVVIALFALIPPAKQKQPVVVKGARPKRKPKLKLLVRPKRVVATPAIKPRAAVLVKRRKLRPRSAPQKTVIRTTGAPFTPAPPPRRKPYLKTTRGKILRGRGAKSVAVKKRRTPYITGVTRNSAGTPIGNCQVFVFRTANETLVAQGVSDSVTGIYLLPVPSYTDNLFVVAYRADAPDIFGTTVNWLTGV